MFRPIMLVEFRSPAVNRKPWVGGISRIRWFAAVNTPTTLDAAFLQCHAPAQRTARLSNSYVRGQAVVRVLLHARSAVTRDGSDAEWGTPCGG